MGHKRWGKHGPIGRKECGKAMRFRSFAGMTRIRFEGFDPPRGSSQPSRMEDTPRNSVFYDRLRSGCPERPLIAAPQAGRKPWSTPGKVAVRLADQGFNLADGRPARQPQCGQLADPKRFLRRSLAASFGARQKPSRKMKYPLALPWGLRYIRPTLSTAYRAPIV